MARTSPRLCRALDARPQQSAPIMLPGKAMSVPAPTRFLMRLAQKATPTPYQGPRNTAQSTFTMCCVGEHLLPNTGKLMKALPTTAIATNMAATASFFVLLLLIFDSPFPKAAEKNGDMRRFPRVIQGRSRLNGLLSRRNTASHRTHIGPNAGRSPSVRRRPSRPAGLISPRLLPCKSQKTNGDSQGSPHRCEKPTPSGGITRIRS